MEAPTEIGRFPDISNPPAPRGYETPGRFNAPRWYYPTDKFRETTTVSRCCRVRRLKPREMSGMTIRRRVTAQSLSSGYLCERSAGTYTPVNRSASSGSTRGRTPAPIDSQAGGLLPAPDNASLKGKREGAVPQSCSITPLAVKSCANSRSGIFDARVAAGRIKRFPARGKTRHSPLHPQQAVVRDYLEPYRDVAVQAQLLGAGLPGDALMVAER